MPRNPAQLAQTSRQMPWYLRSLRKRLGKCRGTCAACANVLVNAAEPSATCANVSANAAEPRAACANAETENLMLAGCYAKANVVDGTLREANTTTKPYPIEEGCYTEQWIKQ